MHAGCAQRVAAQCLGRGQRWHIGRKHFAQGFQFDNVAKRRCRAVGVDVIDRPRDAGHRHVHAAHRAFTGWRDHVGAIGSYPVADQFGVDLRTAGLGVFVFLEHEHAAATGDDETIAIDIIRTRSAGRMIVVAG